MVNDLQGEPGTTPGKRKPRRKKPPTGRPKGRPKGSRNIPEHVWDTMLERLACGEPLITICEETGMPSQGAVYQRTEADPVFLSRYVRARERQADGCFDRIMREAAATDADPQLLRIKIDALKWAASKLLPKKYGEKIEMTGAVGFVPLSDLMAKAAEIRQREALAFGEVIDVQALPAVESAPESLPALGNQQHEGEPK